MSINLCRVVNLQKGGIVRSILLDKIDVSQGNFEGYAQKYKQPVYVPYTNPADSSVAGYINLVETDEVLLAMQPKGTIGGLASAGYISFSVIASNLVDPPTVTAAAHVAGAAVPGQTDAAASVATAVSGVATVTGLTGMTTASVGHTLTISGAALAVNNGTFAVVGYNSATSVNIANPSANGGAGETNEGAIHWVESTQSTVSITGTTLLSVSPDHTHVTLTNLLGASQTITDTQILAAGAPSVLSSTAISIFNGLITIGTPAAGWQVVVKANSQVTASVTLT
jgi:hypothetical protein